MANVIITVTGTLPDVQQLVPDTLHALFEIIAENIVNHLPIDL